MEIDYEELCKIGKTAVQEARDFIEDVSGERIEDVGITEEQLAHMLELGF